MKIYLKRECTVTLRAVACLALILFSSSGAADAIVRTQAMLATTIAEIYIEEDAVRLNLEIGLNDLGPFRNLLPDDVYIKMGYDESPFRERLQNFLGDQFLVIADGQSLRGKLTHIGPADRIRRDDMTGEPLAEEGEPELVVTAEIVWPMNTIPGEIALVTSIPDASVGFVAYHKGIAVNDFRYLGRTQKLILDWPDPWYTRFENRALRRQYDAPMAGFIYVEPYEVRKEIIARPKDLQRWVDLGLDGRDTIPVEIQENVLRTVGEFLVDRQPVTIDGKRATHSLMRVNFLERTLRTSRIIDPPRELDVNGAIIGAIFIYPHDSFAETVTMQWDMFDELVQIVPAAGVDPMGPLPQYLEPDAAMLEWQNFIRVPVMPQLVDLETPPGVTSVWAGYLRWPVSVVAGVLLYLLIIRRRNSGSAGASSGLIGLVLAVVFSVVLWWISVLPKLNDEAEHELVTGLLTNIYRAFDFRDESDVYDVLGRSVAGDLLREVYLEMRGGLVIASQGDLSARVNAVELLVLETESADDGGILARATWQVSATVGHWGHIHQRQNEYEADLQLRPVDGAWKLVAVSILGKR
jgi:hypothetical protein